MHGVLLPNDKEHDRLDAMIDRAPEASLEHQVPENPLLTEVFHHREIVLCLNIHSKELNRVGE